MDLCLRDSNGTLSSSSSASKKLSGSGDWRFDESSAFRSLDLVRLVRVEEPREGTARNGSSSPCSYPGGVGAGAGHEKVLPLLTPEQDSPEGEDSVRASQLPPRLGGRDLAYVEPCMEYLLGLPPSLYNGIVSGSSFLLSCLRYSPSDDAETYAGPGSRELPRGRGPRRVEKKP